VNDEPRLLTVRQAAVYLTQRYTRSASFIIRENCQRYASAED
jgi:hypothetical protein